MAMLGLQDTVDKLARADGVCWYGHGLRKEQMGCAGMGMVCEKSRWGVLVWAWFAKG